MRWAVVVVLGAGVLLALVAGAGMIVTRRARLQGGQELRGWQAVSAGLVVLAAAAWMGWIMSMVIRGER